MRPYLVEVKRWELRRRPRRLEPHLRRSGRARMAAGAAVAL